MEDAVYFLGPQFGNDKAAAFAHADAFILPSYSEGFPMAVLEAWSYGLPVLKTRACNIPDGFDAGAAIEIKPDASSIAEGLRQFTRLPAGEQEAIGRKGRALVEEQYTWPQVALQIRDVYQWVLGDASRPHSVVLD
jgi:poly(glycerol-phosphate) alpha-glucosyltransferase